MARRPPPYGPNARGALFAALTGRTGADVSGARDADLGAQLRAAFGVSRRDPTRPDTAAAAVGLGLSIRQIQRYLRGDSRPSPDTRNRLTTIARQAATTQRGRRAAVAGIRDAHTQRGMRITIRGQQGPSADYARQRTITMNLNPDLAAAFYSAYVDRGDQGALTFLAGTSDQTYFVDSWYFGDITDLNVRDD